MVGASETKAEETMKLITRSELASLNLDELSGLYRETFNALVRSERGTHERRNALGSLENIEREMRSRVEP
jgi:hypothetical protein